MDVSVAQLLARMVVSLVAVLALVAVASRAMRKGRRGLTGRRGPIDVLARQPLGRNASIAVARVGSKTFVLGVTENAIALLAEGGPDMQADIMGPSRTADPSPGDRVDGERLRALTGSPRSTPSKPSWSDFVETLRSRTVRR